MKHPVLSPPKSSPCLKDCMTIIGNDHKHTNSESWGLNLAIINKITLTFYLFITRAGVNIFRGVHNLKCNFLGFVIQYNESNF